MADGCNTASQHDQFQCQPLQFPNTAKAFKATHYQLKEWWLNMEVGRKAWFEHVIVYCET